MFKKTFKSLVVEWGGAPSPASPSRKGGVLLRGGCAPRTPLAFPSALSCGPLQAGPPPTPQTFKKTFKRLAKHLKVFLNVWRHTAKHLKVFF